jgi:hypothetical protein
VPVGPVTNSALANGGFETGAWSPWLTGGNQPAPALVTPTTGKTHANSNYAALLGYTASSGEPTGDSSIQQQFTVPSSGTPTLSLYAWEFTTDTVRYDWQTCQLRSTTGSTLATMFKEASNAQTWVQKNMSLSTWKGRTVVLWCNVHEDGWGDQTYMYVDDFSVH